MLHMFENLDEVQFKNAGHFDTEPYAKITDDEAADLLSQDQIDHLLESIEKS